MPDGMPPETLVKRFFAKMYGFTEEMTEESSLEAVTWWPLIERAEAEAAEQRQKQETQHQQRPGRRY